MLTALRDWWKTGVNDIGAPRPDTISPIPEGIPLLEAERLAREREPGDGSKQSSIFSIIGGKVARGRCFPKQTGPYRVSYPRVIEKIRRAQWWNKSRRRWQRELDALVYQLP